MITLEQRRRAPGLAIDKRQTTATTTTTTTTSTSTMTTTTTMTSTIDVQRVVVQAEEKADDAGWMSAETGRLALSSLGVW